MTSTPLLLDSLNTPDCHQKDNLIPFSDYITLCRLIIEERRMDLQQAGVNASRIIEANCPYEFYPEKVFQASTGRLQYGVLLIHGLFDCPFSLKDIGMRLQSQGMLCRSVLLPGHGTQANDLLHISYQDWIDAVHYGVKSLKQEVDQVFLIGYSTGAILSIYHALHTEDIAGLVLLAPVFKTRAPVDTVVAWHRLLSLVSKNKEWIYQEAEIDYAKYQSIPFNAVTQLSLLLKEMKKRQEKHSLNCPLFCIMSREDETVSSRAAIEYFLRLPNANNRLLLYTAEPERFTDSRITTRASCYPDLHINHFSHRSLLFAPSNTHYGEKGDYLFASNPHQEEHLYGAYNRLEKKILDMLYGLGFLSQMRAELTYNPDFNFMTKEITAFILKNGLAPV